MMVPDSALIGHIMFYEYGSADAQVFKFLKVLAFSGVRCCFDDRINVYVLSVTAQQLLDLLGMKANMKSYNDIANMELEGTLVTIQPTFYVSITMSPDCA
eukprot:6270929-Amphidinium_carterae.1